MYVITCPSCGNVKKVSFARAGAVVHCDKCDKPIRLDRSNTRRVTPPPKPDQGAEAAKLLAERQNEHATRQAGEQAREVVGLSGLSELMAQTSGAAGKTSSGSGGSSGGTSGGDPNDLAALAAEQMAVKKKMSGKKGRKGGKRKKGSGSWLMWLLGALVLIPVVVIVLVLVFNKSLSSMSAPPTDGPEVWASLNVQEVTPTPLVPWDWEELDEPFTIRPDASTAVDLRPPKGYSDEKPSEHMTMAWVSQGGVALQGKARLVMVDGTGKAVAQTYVPLIGVSRENFQAVLVAIPEKYQQSDLSMREAGVEGVQFSPDAKVLRTEYEVEKRVVGEGPDTAVRLSLLYVGDKSAAQMLVLIAGMTHVGEPVRRYVVNWDKSVAPGDKVDFWCRLPVDPSLDIRKWVVTAVACPQPLQLTAVPASSNAPLPTGSSSSTDGSSGGAGRRGGPEFFGVGVHDTDNKRSK